MQVLDVRQLADFVAAHPQAQLLDVREPAEVAIARIELPDASITYMPMMQVPLRLRELDPEQPVVCICHHGGRSAQVGAFLQRQGFTDVYNLIGGIDAWALRIYPRVPRY